MNEELIKEKFKNSSEQLEEVKNELKEIKAEQKEMKKEIQENSDLRFAINNLSEAVSDLKCTVNRLNNKGNESWDKAKWIVITGVITTIISFFLGRFTGWAKF